MKFTSITPYFSACFIVVNVCLSLPVLALEHGTDNHNDGHGSENIITLNQQSQTIAKIATAPLVARSYSKTLYAPGEIKANGYTSYLVSARTESVVIKRHAILGQTIKKGQALVTLFSESVAKAQANYRVAYTEWQRNKQLTTAAISESVLLKSHTAFIEAYSQLKALGLTEQAITDVVNNNSAVLGEYTLTAQRSGSVLSDNFAQGQKVFAGDEIMLLADESNLWVEAKISPTELAHLPHGTKASIVLNEQTFNAQVIQEAHTIDPITRTRIIRLQVNNQQDRLHPGMFVDVNFAADVQHSVLAVSDDALMRSPDGDWLVFEQISPVEFKATEVELGQSFGQFKEIIGVDANTRLVTEGAFFVASELAKTGFDPHNH
ncbi:efflux RND transporter periplasmic adaptor subunit [Thalassotalea sp. PLHSN55]|uniref:efflux RND transporter periplasmic adaptor subunit n=1 Tax=Thalassotalea sp. PLHSN55 TaxID=3435888 RepID=UPI003F86F0D0